MTSSTSIAPTFIAAASSVDCSSSLRHAAMSGSSDAQQRLPGAYVGVAAVVEGDDDDDDRDDESQHSSGVDHDDYHHQQQQQQQQHHHGHAPQGGATVGSSGIRLQTIESGVSLAERGSDHHHHGMSPSSSSAPPVGHPVAPPSRHDGHLLGTIDRPEPLSSSRARLQSDQTAGSYYSVDAGKHGFLEGIHGAAGHHHHHDSESCCSSSSVVSAGDASSVISNGSIVFKYLRGGETPPAEYALPASILGVYGDDIAVEDHVHSGVASSLANFPDLSRSRHSLAYSPEDDGEDDGGNDDDDEAVGREGAYWQRRASGDGSSRGGSKSSIVFSPSYDAEEEANRPLHEARVASSSNSETGLAVSDGAGGAGTPSPRPVALRSFAPSTTTATLSSPSPNGAATAVLPYHERKRLLEREREEEGRRRRAEKLRSMLDLVNDDERTPLNGRVRNNGRGAYGTRDEESGGNDTSPAAKGGWFGRLVSIVSGSSNKGAGQGGRSLEDEARSFRDRGRAFLRKTERERIRMMKERGGSGDLTNGPGAAVLPGSRQSFSHRASSLSNALDSIPSCDSEDEDEETCSSDEETGSSDNSQEWGAAPAPARVWRYGEPPTAVAATSQSSGPSSSSSSRRDRAMRRERLSQEEREYRLRTTTRRGIGSAGGRVCRAFVLVAVATVFMGALGFALVVCVRMLMSI